jgi:parallel beta-helix repeat protein
MVKPCLALLSAVITGAALLATGPPAAAATCIPSGGEAPVQAALKQAGAHAVLCRNAVINVSHTITFTAPNQVIETDGRPTDASRATLRLASKAITTVVNGGGRNAVTVQNIQLDGQLAQLGRAGGGALLELGGAAQGQIVQHINAHDTRSWSTIHLTEGVVTNGVPQCRQAQILDNTIGPAGLATKNQWSDGISLACGNSMVRGNTVHDATDGGIVIFGAPGSTISGNTITATSRVLLGGINLVDYAPTSGNYAGTKVTSNTINAQGALIKVGLAMGPNTWTCSTSINRGASVTGNTLTGNHMGYGYAVNGVQGFTVTGNVDKSHHVGAAGGGCHNGNAKPAGFLMQHQTDSQLQPEFAPATIEYLLGITG